MNRLLKFIIPILIIIAGFILMKFLLSMKDKPQTIEHSVKALSIEAIAVELKDIATEISVLGNVVSADPVELISEVGGTLMEGDVPFKRAQSFSAGDLILKIDDRRIKLQINSTISEFLSALSVTLPNIKTDFPKEFTIWENYFNNVSFDTTLTQLPEVNNQKIKLYLARNNVYKLYYNIRNLEIDLEKHYFYAPFGGTIVSASITLGSTARVGSSLGQILSLEQLEVEMPMSALDAKWINFDQLVEFHSLELSQSWTGSIIRVGQTIDQRTQNVSVYASLDNKQSSVIPNGLFLESSVPGLVIKDAIRVPLKAVYDEQYVYVINNGFLEYREVSIARKETNSVVINSGLKNGDTLVTEVLKGVAQGMPAEARMISIKEEKSR